MQPIIIDCNPGLDDALALLFAFGQTEKFRVQGIVTVAGIQTIEKTTNNACFITQYAPYNIPIIKGSHKPLISLIQTNNALNGLSALIDQSETKPQPEKISMLNFYENELEKASEPIGIFATGPLTNIAIVISQLPHLLHKIKFIAINGGSSLQENTSINNINMDPHSAKIVFESNLEIFLAPLELTVNNKVFKKEIQIFPENTKATKLCKNILKAYLEHSRNTTKDYVILHDTMTLMMVAYPEYFSQKNAKVKVQIEGETKGMIQVQYDHPSSNVHVATKIDKENLLAIFTKTIENIEEDRQND